MVLTTSLGTANIFRLKQVPGASDTLEKKKKNRFSYMWYYKYVHFPVDRDKQQILLYSQCGTRNLHSSLVLF